MSHQEYTVKVFSDRTEWYNKDGQRHRLDGPAAEYANGYKAWYQNGQYHRLDGPAIEYANGDKFWYIDGKHFSETYFNKQVKALQTPSCEGKIVEVDGIKYRLQSL